MSRQESSAIPCGRMVPGPANPLVPVQCSGSKSVVYIYDDHGNITSQQSFPCGSCGQQ